MKKFLVFLLTALMLLSTLTVFASAANLEFNTGITPDPECGLYKKTVLFVGDSITEGRVEWNKGKNIVGWPGRIIEGNKMAGKNKGVSGASISNCRKTNTVLAQLQAESKTEKKTVCVHQKGFSFYPSDQMNFPYGVGIAAFRRKKVIGIYCDKIHTRKDTILEEENVIILSRQLAKILCDSAQ